MILNPFQVSPSDGYGHALADLFTSLGDLRAARRALLETERRGHPEQSRRARARLFTIARIGGDEVGPRRWADAGPPSLVSLVAGAPGPARHRISRGPAPALHPPARLRAGL